MADGFTIFWFVLGLVLLVLEILAPGFVIFWFGVAGILTSLLSWVHVLPDLTWQIIFFSGCSLGLLALWFFVLKRFLPVKNYIAPDTRDSTLTGLKGKVIEKIQKNIPGKVELYEAFHSIQVWKASADCTIETGEEICVKDSNGIILIVEKLAAEQTTEPG